MARRHREPRRAAPSHAPHAIPRNSVRGQREGKWSPVTRERQLSAHHPHPSIDHLGGAGAAVTVGYVGGGGVGPRGADPCAVAIIAIAIAAIAAAATIAIAAATIAISATIANVAITVAAITIAAVATGCRRSDDCARVATGSWREKPEIIYACTWSARRPGVHAHTHRRR